ncbi:hypothetical protein [Stutzerimonas nitrititolerans]|uniref:hypothetical protein n=1 Tax=Stutzerimonas nitrititolerans TaxID=2482751 RepID=UPI0028B21CCF|nr:hypothetical protein [Stutzerimonas nitrititolerans]
MNRVYAEVGASLQQVGGNCPDGWIVMRGERPSPEHVAHEDGSWVVPPTPVPQSVTMRQARLAMLGAGILDDVETAIVAMEGDEGRAARIDWEYALDVRREWPLINSLGSQLGLTEQQIDDLFIAAASIPQ